MTRQQPLPSERLWCSIVFVWQGGACRPCLLLGLLGVGRVSFSTLKGDPTKQQVHRWSSADGTNRSAWSVPDVALLVMHFLLLLFLSPLLLLLPSPWTYEDDWYKLCSSCPLLLLALCPSAVCRSCPSSVALAALWDLAVVLIFHWYHHRRCCCRCCGTCLLCRQEKLL